MPVPHHGFSDSGHGNIRQPSGNCQCRQSVPVGTRGPHDDRVAKAVTDEKCPPRDLAALTKRLDDIVDKIAVLQAAEEQEAVEGGDADDEAFDATAI